MNLLIMNYVDVIYGEVQIDEPVLRSLMASSAMQRLKGVLQHGISGLIGVTSPITRFEHSAGTMLLVRRMGGDLQEQIAALLHDVSHTAFSHVIDYVYNNHDDQSYHEEIKERYMSQTDLPERLARHGYDWRAFIEEAPYPLLEQPAPRLCADRLDYFLRDSVELDLATGAEIQNCLEHLVVREGRIVTDDISTARWLAHTYIAADKASWANFREVGLYELTARAIRRALEVGHVREMDFWGTDEALWRRLHVAQDNTVRETLRLVHPETSFVWDEERPTFAVSTKLRSIDPDIVAENGQVAPLSSIDEQFAAHRAAYHRERAGLWPMRVIAPGEGSKKRPS
ncbi:MAG TPA: HD domain-containing protein [Candidatus Sulfomarinibacteraceae bacterium]|nr:HD domain-containing protein [Candidatus Sulfomarinibacteraceae bacterium]